MLNFETEIAKTFPACFSIQLAEETDLYPEMYPRIKYEYGIWIQTLDIIEYD